MADTERFRGRTIVVTGAAQGLGEGIAEVLWRGGADLMLLDLNGEKLEAVAERLRSAGCKARAMACDVTSEAQVQAAARATQDQFDGCYGLVSNAGTIGYQGVEETPLDEWNRVIAINLTGPFLMARHFGPMMLANGSGAIVIVSSVAGDIPVARTGAYSPSKAGATMLGRQLAVEWGPRGVRTNIVAPGAMDTPMTARFLDDAETRAGREAVVPMKRIGLPTDIAEAAAFLLSDAASYINGARIDVDGGLAHVGMSIFPRKGVNIY